MTAIPQLDIPDIFVDDEEDRQRSQHRATVATAPSSAAHTPSSPDFLRPSSTARPQHQSWSSSVDVSSFEPPSAHPLSLPRVSPSGPSSRRPQLSVDTINVQDPSPGSGESSRRGSAVSPSQVKNFLDSDQNAWVESIRRSATIRKSARKSDWGGSSG